MTGMMSSTRVPSLIVAAALWTWAPWGVVRSEAAPQVFKNGDKVMASPAGMADEQYWRPCVVTNVRDFGSFRGYDIECESQTRGGLPSSFFVNEQWVKAAPPPKGAPPPRNEGATGGTPVRTPAATKEGSAPFKAGDRVEVDVPMMADPRNSVYSRATIDEVDLPNRSYLVTVDPQPGQLPKQFRILIRDYGAHWIRPIQGPDSAPKVVSEKLRRAIDGTVLADREVLACDSLAHGGKNGAAPQTELLKKLVRCLVEQPSQAGMDGATTMDLTSFVIAAPRRWQIYADIGQGSANTLVYPIRASWNQKTFYRTRNEQRTGASGAFTCFVDNFDLWQCGHADGPHSDGKVQQIVVMP